MKKREFFRLICTTYVPSIQEVYTKGISLETQPYPGEQPLAVLIFKYKATIVIFPRKSF